MSAWLVWLVWLIAAGVLAVGEMVTLALVLGMTAGAALAAAAVAGVGGQTAWQIVAFGAVCGALLLGLRPLARRHLAGATGKWGSG
jgi:membrane protein implicated in regulation of membrane protease activity